MATLTRMPTADVNGIEICYQSLGPEEAPTCLLVMGLGAQMLLWPDGLVTELLDRGFRVVRFDNRDAGLSSVTPGDVPDIMAMMAARAAGETVTAPYTFSDMAADAIGLLDHLEVDTAHIVGASLGGMIVQTMAIEYPDRVASVTSIMSTTGAADVGQPDEAAMAALLTPPPTERDAAIAHNVEVGRTISGPLFDEQEALERSRETFDRSFRPAASAFQLAAMGASGDRTERLASVDCPALVIHGRVDPLVTLSGGIATAEAIPGADLMVLADMGHDLPAVYWPQMADAIIGIARRADEATTHHH